MRQREANGRIVIAPQRPHHGGLGLLAPALGSSNALSAGEMVKVAISPPAMA